MYFFKDSNTKPFAIAIVALLIALMVFCLVCIFCLGENPQNIGVNLGQGWYYPLTVQVIKLDRNADIVACVDGAGNCWEFYGVEDWQVGDFASLLMDSKGTSSIYDDEIITARYAGIFEG